MKLRNVGGKKWSASRYALKIEFPDRQDMVCEKIKRVKFLV